MIETLITAFVASFGTMLITCILGCYNYYATHKIKFSFLRLFPFEMQNDYKMPYSKYVRFTSAFFAISATLFGLLLIEDKSEPISILLMIVILLNALTVPALFLFDLTSFKTYIISAVLNFATLILMFGLYGLYIMWWIDPIAKEVFGYISVIIAVLMIVFLFNPRLFTFMYLTKQVDNGEIKCVRPKYNAMSIYQWSAILMTLLFQVLVIVSIMIK